MEKKTKAANRAEIDAFNYLCASAVDVQEAQKAMEKRIRMIPGGWRDVKLIESKLIRLNQGIAETFEPEKQRQILRTAQALRHRLVFAKDVVRKNEDYLIEQEDMGLLVGYATECCKMRMCTAAECRKCKLGKLLDRISFVSRRKDQAWWDVFNEAEGGENGANSD